MQLKKVSYPNPNGVGKEQEVVYLVSGDKIYYAGTTCGVSTHKTAFPIAKICEQEGWENTKYKKFFEVETCSGYARISPGTHKVSEVKFYEGLGIVIALGVVQPEAGAFPKDVKKAFAEIIG